MELAGEETLARWIKREGALDLTLLERFGDDLLRTVKDSMLMGLHIAILNPRTSASACPAKSSINSVCLISRFQRHRLTTSR